jgi:hypothetical protein
MASEAWVESRNFTGFRDGRLSAAPRKAIVEPEHSVFDKPKSFRPGLLLVVAVSRWVHTSPTWQNNLRCKSALAVAFVPDLDNVDEGSSDCHFRASECESLH